MDVLMISPGYPAEMPIFTAALAAEGANVIGVGDQPVSSLPDAARHALSRYVQISSFADEERAVDEVLDALRGANIDRVESMWEATMYLAARLRERIGAPGLDVAGTIPFRDKESMKEVLRAAGIRVPRSVRASTIADVHAGAEEVGYPLIIKPISGAGSMDTYRIDEPAGLEPVLPALRAVPEVSVEEFVDGEEFTFDSISTGGRVAYYNVCWYRPRPLVMKQLEWVSPQTIALREPGAGPLAAGVAMGHDVLAAMGLGDGFAHMEWYLKPDGEVVFGEIGARVGGARLADAMNWACDIDVYRGWAETVVHGRFSQHDRAQVQHRDDLQAGPGPRPHPTHRGPVPTAGRDRRAHRAHRPPPDRGTAPRLADHRDLRRPRGRPPPRPRRDDRDGRPRGHRAPAVRRLSAESVVAAAASLGGNWTVRSGPMVDSTDERRC